MKVKDLMKQLQNADPEAHVHIQTDERFEEDIAEIINYGIEEGFDICEVIVLCSRIYWTKD